MNLLTNLLWRLMPVQERKMLLSYAPQYQQRHIERVIKGKAIYQPCFDDHKALFIHVPKVALRSDLVADSLFEGLYIRKAAVPLSAPEEFAV